jgi:hypothetical protein
VRRRQSYRYARHNQTRPRRKESPGTGEELVAGLDLLSLFARHIQACTSREGRAASTVTAARQATSPAGTQGCCRAPMLNGMQGSFYLVAAQPAACSSTKRCGDNIPGTDGPGKWAFNSDARSKDRRLIRGFRLPIDRFPRDRIVVPNANRRLIRVLAALGLVWVSRSPESTKAIRHA